MGAAGAGSVVGLPPKIERRVVESPACAWAVPASAEKTKNKVKERMAVEVAAQYVCLSQ